MAYKFQLWGNKVKRGAIIYIIYFPRSFSLGIKDTGKFSSLPTLRAFQVALVEKGMTVDEMVGCHH